jgi:cholesterol transport system auxiliary component
MRTTVNQTMPRLLIAATISAAALLSGCATSKGPSNTLYDFGPAGDPAGDPPPGNPATGNRVDAGQLRPPALRALVVTDATGSSALDSERMFYRLNYADAMQARTYANSRWSANPLQMVTQRFKARIAQSGVKVLSTTDASTGVPLLRVEVEDFVHAFSSSTQSEGQLVLRASLFQGHTLVDQKIFRHNTAARSADAAGGASALAASTDAVASEVVTWLATLPLRKE